MKISFSLYLVALFSLLAIPGLAQKAATPSVPAAAKAAFEKAYPGATKVKWSREKEDFEVDFLLASKEMAAVYTGNGVLKETEEAIAVKNLPQPVLAYIKQHYSKAVIKEAAKVTKADGTINFEAEVNHTDLIFDTNGNFIREEKDAD